MKGLGSGGSGLGFEGVNVLATVDVGLGEVRKLGFESEGGILDEEGEEIWEAVGQCFEGRKVVEKRAAVVGDAMSKGFGRRGIVTGAVIGVGMVCGACRAGGH